VLDHADGNSMGYGVTIADGHAFVSGSMKTVVRVENPETGEAIETTDEGTDGDVFLAKVSLDGAPTAIWTYSGSLNEFPAHLATSRDDAFVSMTGYFAGSITFGDFSFFNGKDGSQEIHARELDDGFVVKIAAANGTVAWARHIAADGGATCSGTSFDAAGNVVVVGRRCELSSEGTATACVGFCSLLAADDGATLWDRDFGTGIASFGDVVAADDGKLYAVGSVLGTVTIDAVEIASATETDTDALLLVLDATDGTASWAATISSGASSLVEVVGDAVFMNCYGSCETATSTATTHTMTLEDGSMGGAVVKLSTAGAPLWLAAAPYTLGMGATADAVYVNYYATGSQTYGDATFSAWGSFDHYITKYDAETGAGAWVLQTGGQGLEYVRRMATDSNGDLYSVGLTMSDPTYFDPLVVDSHLTTDGYDLFLAKLKTSDETLPACKTDETTVADGYCFVNNACYESGESSRGFTEQACMACSPADSQSTFTMASGYCFIDGACYADGAPGSVCQSCDVSVSTDSWTLNSDDYTLGADGTCIARTTWTTQSATLPQFEWVVLDHADGNSMGYGVTIADGHAFVSGSMKTVVRVENPETGEAIETTDEGTDGDVFLAKVSLDGAPTAIWTYSGSLNEFPAHLATSRDDAFVSMTGYFAGSITFGDFSFFNGKDGSQEIHARELDDGFVVKIAAANGTVAWARHIAADGGATCSGTSFDAAGNVVVVGRRCELSSEGTATACVGFCSLLAADDGATLWDRDFGTGIASFGDVVAADDGKLYAVGSVLGTVTIDAVEIASATETDTDALLLVLDATDGTASWAATISSGASSLVEVVGDAVFMNCYGSCETATSTATTHTMTLEDGSMGGAVVKLSTAGAPLWLAAAPYTLGMGATADAVYVNYYATGSQTYGDATFSAWGSFDHYITKYDAETGAGAWVLQTGGQGLEYVRRMATDSNGDLYSVGLTMSDPTYFDPLVVDSHLTTDGYDLFLAKLKTSDETLPACKTDETTVADGYCFVNNACYESGESSRGFTEQACMACSPADSQSTFTMASGYCFIDGACYADGAPGSVCQSCDVSVSTDSWTLNSDDYTLGADGTCIARIAGYFASTDVSTHSMIDLDAKEIEEYSDAAAWETALFVYESGGGGLCSEDDIAAAVEGDACYGKTTSDARGNSIKGSGEIRTIQGFATSGRAKMSNQPFWNLYRDYYNDDNYADTFIRNALSPDGAWSSRSDALRAELSAKGAKYQAVWMYVIHEMEDAVADCLSGDIFDNQASNAAGDSPHAWDEAWAFYAGSLEGLDGSGRGYLLYDLAEKRCPQFGTCGASGGAIANEKALGIANAGLEKILAADCAGVAEELAKFVVQMTIPLVQGLVRYLYLADPVVNGGSCSSNGVCDYDKEWAEAWAFAAAVLPQVDRCSSVVAQILNDNVNVDGVDAPMKDGYEFVKSQVELVYPCLGISCADIGAYQSDAGVVFPGMDACLDAPATWRAHHVDVSAPSASEVHTGDIDGDGDVDVVAASWGDHRFAWHENVDGAGTQWREVLISDDSDGIGAGPLSVVLCDVDADGDLDAVTGSSADDDDVVAWHENLGAGAAWTEHVVQAGGASSSSSADAPYGLLCADLDGDGRAEIVSARFASGTVDRHVSADGGASWTTTTLASDVAGAHAVAAADVDGDGDDDVVVASNVRGVVVLENPSWTQRVVDAASVLDVAAADLDGDGAVDLVSASYAESAVHLHALRSGASFATSLVAGGIGGAYSVAIADITHDDDGLLDIASCGWLSGGVYVHAQTSSGAAWTTAEIAGDTAPGANSVAAADVNGDGAMDVVVAASAGVVLWFENPAGVAPGPPGDSKKKKTTTTDAAPVIALAVVLGVVVVACLALAVALYATKKRTRVVGVPYKKTTKNTLVAEEVKDDASEMTDDQPDLELEMK